MSTRAIDPRAAIVPIEHGGRAPDVADGAYLAPTAVVRGDVVIHEGTAVLFVAVITAEGGPVVIGRDCVVMENAVLRGIPRHPLTLGDRTLVGPRCHLTGCEVEADTLVATRATAFDGARLGAGSEVRIHGVVHVSSGLPAEGVVPIGWVVVGDPAELYPPSEHERIREVQRTPDFPGTVFESCRETARGRRTLRDAPALTRQIRDTVIDREGRP